MPRRRSVRGAAWAVALVCILALPRRADAYVEPGTGAMLWQLAAATALGSVFYVRRIAQWFRARMGLSSPKAAGFVFASIFALATSPLMLIVFQPHPVPRFNDVYLVGIVLTAYLYTWESAAYLLMIALGVSAYVLPPAGSLVVASPLDWYRLASFAAIAAFLIGFTTRVKRERARRFAKTLQMPKREESPAAVPASYSAANG